MDEIGESFGMWRSAINGDKKYPLLLRLMTDTGLGFFLLLSLDILCVGVRETYLVKSSKEHNILTPQALDLT